jgi:hypothetical protein
MRKLKLPYLLMAVIFMLTLSINSIAQKSKTDAQVSDELALKAQNLPSPIDHKPLPVTQNKAASYLSEDFESWPPTDWTFITSGAGFIGDGVRSWSGAQAAFHNDDTGDQADWLVSPAVVIPSGLAVATLSWFQSENYASYADVHNVAVSLSADMSDSVIVYTGLPPEDDWEQVNVDLTDYVGSTIYVGFYYQGNWADEWWIDDVLVQGPSDENDITSFDVANQVGDAEIDADAHTVMAWVMYDSTLTLSPTVGVSAFATIDPASGTEQDFSNPVTYTVTSQSGMDQDWEVTVMNVAPMEGTEILDISVDNAVDYRWDGYGHRIEVDVMYDSTLTLEPMFTLSDFATISPEGEQDFSGNLGVTYTVSPQDPEGESLDWRVIIENVAPSMEVDINDVIHDSIVDLEGLTDTSAIVYVTTGTDLSTFAPEFDLSFGATISPASGSSQDFTSGGVVYTVTAQDEETMQEYVLYAELEDVDAPTVTAEGTTVENYGDSIMVSSNEDGWVHLVAAVGGAELTNVWVDADVETPIYSDNLKVGKYFAYAADTWGNVSDTTTDTIFVNEATVEVANIAGLWDMMYMNNIMFVLTGEAVVTFTQSYRNQKWLQDTTGGIMIDDNAHVIPDQQTKTPYYSWGDGVTGLTGHLTVYRDVLEFIPSEIPTLSSTGNEIVPVEVTVDEFNSTMYQSQVVMIKNIRFDDANGTTTFSTGTSYDFYSGDSWGVAFTNYYTADYIGEIIPEGAQDVVGIAGQYYGTAELFPRAMSDFMDAGGPVFYINTDMVDFGGVLFGESASGQVHIMNRGNGDMVVHRAYITGGEGNFIFTDAPFINQTVQDTWLNLLFAPNMTGSFNATFVVEYGDGMMAEVALSGSAANIPEYGYPWHEDFENGLGDWINHETTGIGFVAANLWDGIGAMHVGYNNPDYPPATDILFTSPKIDVVGAEFPVLKFEQYMYNIGYANTELWISPDGGDSWDNFGYITTSASSTVEEFVLDLSDYKDKTIMIGFYINEPDYGYGSPITGWQIDNVAVEEGPVTPLFMTNAGDAGYPVTEVGSSSEFDVNIWNSGISFFTVDDVTITGANADQFTLIDDNTYPWEVGNEGYDLYLNKNMVSLMVDYTPTATGDAEATLVIEWTDPRLGSFTEEFALNGTAISCAEAAVAEVGMNEVPFASNWFEYTPPVDQLVTVSSCMAGQFVDTDVEIYNNCDGHVVAANDDEACDASGFPYSSTVTFAAAAGNTYKILWKDTWEPTGFTFTLDAENLNVAPTLTSISSAAINADDANVTLTWDPAPQIDPDTKGASSGIGAAVKVNIDPNIMVFGSKPKCDDTLVPVGDPEVEPNTQTAPQVIEIGPEDAPTQITGVFQDLGGGGSDWFTFTLESSSYVHAYADYVCGDGELWVLQQSLSGYVSHNVGDGVPESVTTPLWPAGDYIVLFRRATQYNVVDDVEGGYKYNLSLWTTQPPKFHIYRDNFEIAYDNMAFEYTDVAPVGVNSCYKVSEELYDGSESNLSNQLCITPEVGPGQICDLAIEAVDGMNWSEGADYYYYYTATSSGQATITSCLEENADAEPDTRIFIYADCNITTPGVDGGNEITFNDDDGCPYTADGYQSTVEFTVAEGVTYIIMFDDEWDNQGFWYDISIAPLMPGQICESAIPLALPAVGEAGSTAGFGDDYDALDCNATYITGDDKCYVINVDQAGYLNGDITGTFAGLYVIKGLPGDDDCIAFGGGSNGGSFSDIFVNPGQYFVIVSSWVPTQTTDFVFNLSLTPVAPVDITFNVDMNVQMFLNHFDPATDSVDMVSNVSFWTHTGNMTDVDGDGIYSMTVPGFAVGEPIKYKYRINGDWNLAEFGPTIYTNRTYVPVVGTNQTMDLYNNQQKPTSAVTFYVNMLRAHNVGLFDPANNDFVDLAGDFNDWSGGSNFIMVPSAPGSFVYKIMVPGLVEGTTVEFKFRINGTMWEDDIENRTYVVKVFDSETPTYWFDDMVDNADLLTRSERFSVYPNPNKGVFNVALASENSENYTIALYNLQGQVVYSNVISNVTKYVNTIDVSELAKGVYYLKVNEYVEKIVIE